MECWIECWIDLPRVSVYTVLSLSKTLFLLERRYFRPRIKNNLANKYNDNKKKLSYQIISGLQQTVAGVFKRGNNKNMGTIFSDIMYLTILLSRENVQGSLAILFTREMSQLNLYTNQCTDVIQTENNFNMIQHSTQKS